MRQIAGRDDVRQRRACHPPHAPAFGKMNFDEIPMFPTAACKGIERLDDTCPGCPTAASPTRQRDHCNLTRTQCLQSQFVQGCPLFRIQGRENSHIPWLCIFDRGTDR